MDIKIHFNQILIVDIPHSQAPPTTGCVVLQYLHLKNMLISGPVQFKPVFFKGQLYIHIYVCVCVYIYIYIYIFVVVVVVFQLLSHVQLFATPRAAAC